MDQIYKVIEMFHPLMWTSLIDLVDACSHLYMVPYTGHTCVFIEEGFCIISNVYLKGLHLHLTFLLKLFNQLLLCFAPK